MTALLLDDPARVLVEAVCAVEGVARAVLEPDPADVHGPGLLRLDLAPGAAEVAVATRVGHLLRSRFDLSVDTGALQLVETFGALAPSGRVVSTGTSVTSAGPSVTASSSVEVCGRPGTGSGTAAATASGSVQACARAALAAAVEASEGLGLPPLELTSAVVVETAGGREAVVGLATPVGSLVGRSVVAGDARQAAVRAVLDAVRTLLPG